MTESSRTPGTPGFAGYYRLDLAAGPRAAAGEPVALPGSAAFGRVLSVALAMKGGVSLAVWIGGAVAEIDLLRRIRIQRVGAELQAYFAADPGVRSAGAAASSYDTSSEPDQLIFTLARADLYAQALVSRGYDRIDVDVLAGASAGGLNAILYGVAQRAGTNFDRMISVWATAGSAWKLLRGGSWRTVPSALGGDSYFWPRVREAIAGFYGWVPHEDHATRELSIDLSATIADREYQSTPGTQQGRGHFHFVGAEDPADATDGVATTSPPRLGTVGRNIPRAPAFVPGADGTPMNPDVDRLAYAARTTSSFPGAFEPARIWSRESDAADPAVDGDRVEMTFAFSAHRRPTDAEQETVDPYSVIDGGVLDNIPIDRVQRAIRNRTPRDYSDRIVLYLDPSPDQAPLVRLRPDEADPPSRLGSQNLGKPSFLRTISQGLSMRGTREDGSQEVDDLDAARRAQLYGAARAQAFAASAAADVATDVPVETFRDRYRSYRAVTDLDLLGSALQNPDLWQLTSDLPTRRHGEPTPEKAVRYLDATFLRLYDDPATPSLEDGVRSGSQALRDATLCALDWVRQLDDFLFETQPDHHAARQACDLMRTSIHRIALDAIDLRDHCLRAVLSDQDLVAGFRGLTSADPGESPAAELAAVWLAQEALSDTGASWTELDVNVRALRGLSAQVDGFVAQPTAWARFPEWSAKDLAPWIAAQGVPDSSAFIQYAEIDSAEPTQDPAEFYPELREAQLAEIVSGWLKLRQGRWAVEASAQNLPSALDPAAKLAGSTLANFGAFFSVDWRLNDWWWGRVDAAAGLLRVISTLASADGASPLATPALVQALVLRQANVSGDLQRPFPSVVRADAPDLERAISRSLSAGAHTFAQLSPAYLVSVASRAVRVAVRATRSDQPLLVKTLLSLFLPPLLVIAPYAFAPVRAAFALVSALAVLQAVGAPTGAPDATRHSGWGELALGALALVVGATAAAGTLSTWRRIGTLEPTIVDRVGSAALRPLRSRAVRAVVTSAVLLVAGVLLAIALVIDEFESRPVDAQLVFLAVATAILPMVARTVAVALGSSSQRRSIAFWTVLTALGAVCVIGQTPLLLWASRTGDAPWLLQLTAWLATPSNAAAVIAAIVFGSVTWGWIGGVAPDWHRLLGLLPWAALSLLTALTAGFATSRIIAVIADSHADAGYDPGFGAGLAAAFAAWFLASHVGWWLSDLLPTHRWDDLDHASFRARVPEARA